MLHDHFGSLSMKPKAMSTFSSGSKVEKVQLIHIFHLLAGNGSRRSTLIHRGMKSASTFQRAGGSHLRFNYRTSSGSLKGTRGFHPTMNQAWTSWTIAREEMEYVDELDLFYLWTRWKGWHRFRLHAESSKVVVKHIPLLTLTLKVQRLPCKKKAAAMSKEIWVSQLEQFGKLILNAAVFVNLCRMCINVSTTVTVVKATSKEAVVD